MKSNILIGALALIAVLAPIAAPSAHALSCLSVDMYLKDIVGKEEIVILVGTATDQIEETNYTAEVLTVSEVKQGYAENEIFAYHRKDATWGYLCNAGPAKNGEKSLYITERDTSGKYQVYQRLALTDPLVDTLEADLEDIEMTGIISDVTTTDRMNQIMTIISDLITEIQTLFKEYLYLKAK